MIKHGKCDECSKSFLKRRESNRFCCKKCVIVNRSKIFVGEKASRWNGGKKTKKCLLCGKSFKTYRQKFCSVKCMGLWQGEKGTKRGENNGMWKGGKLVDKNGYILILKRDHPHSRNGYVLEHRLKMEKKLGRFLNKDEIVHHRNEIKSDNRLSNLELMNKKDHDRYHTVKRHEIQKLFIKLT